MATGPIDIDALRAWIGRRETRSDLVTAAPIAALAATLDRDDEPTTLPLPPLYHWLYFLPIVPLSAVGADGHPARGGFLPPVPLPRRMWAASRLVFHQALHVGDSVTRVSEISDVQMKDGKSGPLVFVKLTHTVMAPDGTAAITEEQDIVYRDDPKPGDAPAVAKPAPTDAAWRRELQPDPVLLFRYSALTFNGHRIHYDRGYVTEVEGYPGLIVHGPLIATLLLDLLRRQMPQAQVRSFNFKAASPLFDISPFTVCGKQNPDASIALWARNHHGHLAMQARAELA